MRKKKNEIKTTWFTWAAIAVGLVMIAISVYAVVRDPSLDSTDRIILTVSPFITTGFFMMLMSFVDKITDNTAKLIVFALLFANMMMMFVLIDTPVGEVKPIVYQWFSATSYGLTVLFGFIIGDPTKSDTQ